MELTLRSDGKWWLEDKQLAMPPIAVSKDELVQRIRAKQAKAPEQPVVIAADKSARYEDVIGVLDLLQRSGAQKVGLLARPVGNK